jgi:hypothetical protein
MYGCGVLLTWAVCLVVYHCRMLWGVVFVLLVMGEVSVLLFMIIRYKCLIHRFVNRVIVVDIKFIHIFFLVYWLGICSICQDCSEIFLS